MPRIDFALEAKGPPRVAVSWELVDDKFTVVVDKKQQGDPGTRAELLAGRQYRFPDGKFLIVQLIPGVAADEASADRVHAWLDGRELEPIRGIGARDRVRNTSTLLFIIGALDLLFAWLLIARIGFSFDSLPRAFVTGALFVLLGWGVLRQSTLAARLALIVAGIDMMLSLRNYATIGAGLGIALTLVSRTLLIFSLLNTIGALRELKELRESKS